MRREETFLGRRGSQALCPGLLGGATVLEASLSILNLSGSVGGAMIVVTRAGSCCEKDVGCRLADYNLTVDLRYRS